MELKCNLTEVEFKSVFEELMYYKLKRKIDEKIEDHLESPDHSILN